MSSQLLQTSVGPSFSVNDMQIIIPFKEVRETPVLALFLSHFCGEYQRNGDTKTIMVPETMTMIDLWDTFPVCDLDRICNTMATIPQFKNIHRGQLAFYRVIDIISALVNRRFIQVLYRFQIVRPENLVVAYDT